MLCPQCGSEVGETLALCEKCQASNSQSAAVADQEHRTAIGAIRPNLKVVRLNRQKAEQSTGGDPSAAHQSSAVSNFDPSNPVGDFTDNGNSPPRSFRGLLVTVAGILILASIGLAAWQMRDAIQAWGNSLPALFGASKPDGRELKEVIQIRVRPDPNDLESRSKFGYAIVGYNGLVFRIGQAKFSRKSSVLTIKLSTEFAKENNPEMVIEFAFAPNVTELSLDKLLNFTTRITLEGETVTFNKVYSPKAIGLNVVPRLNGTLGSNPVIKLLFNESENRTLSGGGIDYAWKLYINMPLTVEP